MDPIVRKLLAAQGYSELGMTVEALDELDRIESSVQDRPEVLETRLFVLMRDRRWRDALGVSRRICEIQPDAPGGFIHAAFCLHELKETQAARAVLLAGPTMLKEEAIFHYNLACYECVLGNIDAARAHLGRSIELDRKYRDFATHDADLRALRKKR